LSHTRLAEFCDVVQRDALRCVPALRKLGRAYDLVFVCPPFPLLRSAAQAAALMRMLGELAQTGLLNQGAQVILQHEKWSIVSVAPSPLETTQRREFGRNRFTFYAAEPRRPEDVVADS
jgi:16S rRNA G966 N2-methylase RsmD